MGPIADRQPHSLVESRAQQLSQGRRELEAIIPVVMCLQSTTTAVAEVVSQHVSY